jgi:parvulin-like peptidyl-prolyl isomerase
MGIKAQNIIIRGTEEEEKPQRMSLTMFAKKAEEEKLSTPVYERKVESEIKTDDEYYRVKDESLEKLYKKKSAYLADMISIDLK